jgi:hypothetical protein
MKYLLSLCIILSSAVASAQVISPGNTVKAAAVFATAAGMTAGAMGSGYGLVVDLPDDTIAVLLDNQTNGDVAVSIGGSSDTFYMPAGRQIPINLGGMGRKTTAGVYAKDGTSPSTTGVFWVYSFK